MADRVWSEFACPNPKCQAFGQRGLPSIRPHGWSSKPRNIRCLRCTVCGHSFSERAGTPFFRSQLPQEKIVAIAQHVVGRKRKGKEKGSGLNGIRLSVASFAA